VTCRPLIWRVLVWMIGFIISQVTHSHVITHGQYNAITILHRLQSTFANALGFSVSTSRLLATDLDTQTVNSFTLQILHVNLLHRSTLHNSRQYLVEIYSGGRSSSPGRVQNCIFFVSSRPDRFWSPTSLLSNGYRGLFPQGCCDRGVMLPTQL
jgi:hypothetical protein